MTKEKFLHEMLFIPKYWSRQYTEFTRNFVMIVLANEASASKYWIYLLILCTAGQSPLLSMFNGRLVASFHLQMIHYTSGIFWELRSVSVVLELQGNARRYAVTNRDIGETST